VTGGAARTGPASTPAEVGSLMRSIISDREARRNATGTLAAQAGAD
jgi:hypothetical protein